jgi:hypothetical protein
MNYFIAKIIRHLFAPRHEISCSWATWRNLLGKLRERGFGTRESGAFLLGYHDKAGRRRITDFVLYDDIDPHALDTGIVHLDGRHFGKLWDICAARNVTVVADVHTHPWGATQSDSDRAHPIIAQAGHIALIIPNFAEAPVALLDVGIYRYLGGRKWQSVSRHKKHSFLAIGI